jgi:hypothetical protein
VKTVVKYFMSEMEGNLVDEFTYMDANYIIPQIGSRAWLLDNAYKVVGIDYGFAVDDDDYNLIEVYVEESDCNDYVVGDSNKTVMNNSYTNCTYNYN